MDKTETKATELDEDLELQPEGGLTDEDILDSEEFTDDVLDELFADATEDDDTTSEEEADESKKDGADDPTPTTEQDDDAAEEPDEEEEAPTTEPDADLPKTLKFNAKIDRKEQSIELDESELPKIYQKAHNYDRITEKYNKVRSENEKFKTLALQLGYESVEEMVEQASKADRESKIQELVDGGTSKEIAEDFIDRKIKTAKDKAVTDDSDEDEDDNEPEEDTTASQKDDESFFKEQVADFFTARPDLKGKLKTLPKEVSEALIARKGTLRELYAEWESTQQKADVEKIRKEKAIFAQQAEAASRAPVRGAQETHTEKQEKPDALRDAFKNDMSW